MIIPNEVKDYIKQCIKEETQKLLDLIRDLKIENDKLKIEINILKEGDNI